MADLVIPGDFPDGVPGVRGLLSCGHYASPVHERSSTWDFPHDPHVCPHCGEERQFDLRLQAAIIDSWSMD